ncbi:MAG TPA: 5-formyltetrahydrofolate cyclo-ligase [Casimicrobiaceae bacterium]|nr:5-formyltetrahydrofolate cyclo-ligase [Casimicrobiaceae bacterium]
MPTPAPDLDRIALRKSLREKRAAIPASERIAASTALLAQLEAIPEFLTDTNVAGYWAVAGELPLAGIMGGIRGRGQVYHLPVIDDQKRLRFAPWLPGMDVAPNRFGIPEPTDTTHPHLAPDAMDVVLVPLLGFDRHGHRLGFGGGYYDRAFEYLRDLERPAKPLLVGIGYALQEIDRIEPRDWDVPLDYVATERELIDFTNPER